MHRFGKLVSTAHALMASVIGILVAFALPTLAWADPAESAEASSAPSIIMIVVVLAASMLMGRLIAVRRQKRSKK